MEEITERLHERFPLLARLNVQSVEANSVPEHLPPYIGLLLSVMDAAQNRPICFILPRRGEVGRLATVLYALHRFAAKQSQLTQSYGEENFKEGDFVRVHPGRHVFKYGGFDAKSPDFIWLGTLDGTGNWQVRAADVVARLEKTTLRRPIGRLDSPILSPPPAPLDMLLGTSCFGNHSVMKNEVALLDSLSGLTGFVESAAFQVAPPMSHTPALKLLLPFGEISEPTTANAAWFKKWDDRNPTGEPLIAATRSAEVLANYCIDARAFTKLVVVNGLSRLRGLQAYDDIAQTQRLVLLADHADEEMIEVLGKRGCVFWCFGGTEHKLLGNPNDDVTYSILNPVTRWARNYHDLKTDDEPCENAQLDEVCLRLNGLPNTKCNLDETTLTSLVRDAWGMFSDARAAVAAPTASERARALAGVDSFRQRIQGCRAWISPEVALALAGVADALCDCYGEESKLGINKGAALYRTLSQTLLSTKKIALLARRENCVPELQRWVNQRYELRAVKVFSQRTLPDDGSVEHVICASWPGGDMMRQIVSKLAAPRITLVGYPFERRWLKQCQSRLKRHSQVPSLTGKENAEFVFRGSEPKPAWPEEATPPPTTTATAPDSDIWNFERKLQTVRLGLAARPTVATETVQAHYVRFAGDYYAFLTESHKIPVATDLISKRARSNQKLPERTVMEIKLGDFVVFPESGDREFVQQLADKKLEPLAPQLRKLARRWKDALQKSGLTPDEFQLHARNFNRHRHPATIRHWFAESSQIGPRDKDDLLLIALVTGDQLLEDEIDDVRLAIERLWGTHLSAGMQLHDALLQRLPHVIDQVEENGTKVDLGELGSAWVVQVEAIDPSAEPRGRGEVNRLLSESSDSDTMQLL